tara:strand:- start:514 stop:741 length:228 start_codon:yes stop_codon:yes gene_type:complete
MHVIDARGPDGNAFAIMAHARKIGRQLELEKFWPKGKTEEIIKDMTSGDYEHLCTTFNKQFENIAEVEGWENEHY